MGGAAKKRDRRAMAFVDPGMFQRQAELMRIKQKFGQAGLRQLRSQERRAREKAERRAEDEAAAAAEAEAGGDDPNMVPLGARPQARGVTSPRSRQRGASQPPPVPSVSTPVFSASLLR